MKNLKKVMAVLLSGVLILGSLVIFGGCKKQAPLDWWKDYDNLTFVVTDERSDTEDYVYQVPDPRSVTFEYTFISQGIPEEELEQLIPDIKVLYKGEEKEVYCHKYWKQRELWTDYWEEVAVVKLPGKYRVHLELYLREETYWEDQPIVGGKMVYINVNKGAQYEN